MATEKAAKPKAAKTEGEEGGVLGRLSELAWQALPAIGSAIGFAGFVAVIGAAIEWIRFDAARLPATQAVLAVPRQELVIVGALALAVFVFGGLLAVILVYLIDRNGDATRRTVRAIVWVGVLEMLAALFYIDAGAWWNYAVLIAGLLVLGLVAGDLGAEAMSDFRARSALERAATKVIEARDALTAARLQEQTAREIAERFPKPKTLRAREQADLAVVAAVREWQRSVREWAAAVKRILIGLPAEATEQIEAARKEVVGYGDRPPDGDVLASELGKAEDDTRHVFLAIGARLRQQISGALEAISAFGLKLANVLQADRRRAAERTRQDGSREGEESAAKPPPSGLLLAVVALGVLLLLAALAGLVYVLTTDLFSWLAVVLGVVVLLTTVNVFVARATEKFAWYGIAVFFSVLAFGAAVTIAKDLDRPSAQPIALVRKSDAVGICGVFITQTSDRVYVGRSALIDSETKKLIRPGLIFWVPTSDVDLIDVGQFERIGTNFPEHAERMLAQLYKDGPDAAKASAKPTTITEVVGEAVKPGAKQGKQTTTTREGEPQESPAKAVKKPTPHEQSVARKTCTAPLSETATASSKSAAVGG
jgi:hypothetical protein